MWSTTNTFGGFGGGNLGGNTPGGLFGFSSSGTASTGFSFGSSNTGFGFSQPSGFPASSGGMFSNTSGGMFSNPSGGMFSNSSASLFSGATFGSNTGFSFGNNSGFSPSLFGNTSGTTPTTGFSFGSTNSTGLSFGNTGNTGFSFSGNSNSSFGGGSSGFSFSSSSFGNPGNSGNSGNTGGFGFGNNFGSGNFGNSGANTGFSFGNSFGSPSGNTGFGFGGSSSPFGASSGFNSTGSFGSFGSGNSGFSFGGSGNLGSSGFSFGSSLGSTSGGFSFGSSTPTPTTNFGNFGNPNSGSFNFGNPNSGSSGGGFSFGTMGSVTNSGGGFGFGTTGGYSGTGFSFNSFGSPQPSSLNFSQPTMGGFSSFPVSGNFGTSPNVNSGFQFGMSQPPQPQLEASLTKDPFGILPPFINDSSNSSSSPSAPIVPVGPASRPTGKINVTPHYKQTPHTGKLQPRNYSLSNSETKPLEYSKSLFETRTDIKKLSLDLSTEEHLSSPLFDKKKKAALMGTPFKYLSEGGETETLSSGPGTTQTTPNNSEIHVSIVDTPVSTPTGEELVQSPTIGLIKKPLPPNLRYPAYTEPIPYPPADISTLDSPLPKVTRRGYYTKPDMEILEKMSPDQLKAVPDFTVGLVDVGEVTFLGETDVIGVDIDEIVRFDDRSVEVYPEGTDKPSVGQGLNKPSVITLLKCWPKDKVTRRYKKDPQSLKEFETTLIHRCKRFPGNCKFRSYTPETGKWVFHVEHFTKYGLDDDDDDDDPVVTVVRPGQKGVTDVDTVRRPVTRVVTDVDTVRKTPGTVVTDVGARRGTAADVVNDAGVRRETVRPPTVVMTKKIPEKTESESEKYKPIPRRRYVRSESDSSGSEDSLPDVEEDRHIFPVPRESHGSYDEEEEQSPSIDSGEEYALETDMPDSDSVEEEVKRPKALPEQIGLDLSKMHAARQSGNLFSSPPPAKQDSPFSPKQYFTSERPPLSPLSSVLYPKSPLPDTKALTSPSQAHWGKLFPVKREIQILTTPFPESVVSKKIQYSSAALVDRGFDMARSFRVGWGPGGHFVRLLPPTDSRPIGTLAIERVHAIPQSEQTTYVTMLETHLRMSKKHLKKTLPTFRPNKALFDDHVAGNIATLEALLAEGDNKSIKSMIQIWKLVKALFGTPQVPIQNDYHHQLARGFAVSEWLRTSLTDTPSPLPGKASPSSPGSDVQEEDRTSEEIFRHLSGKRIREAAEVALACGDGRLASLIAQVASRSVPFQKAIADQIRVWRDTGVIGGDPDEARIHPERMRIYLLLSGNVNSVCKSLDWKSALGLHMWYTSSRPSQPLPSLSDVLQDYTAAFENGYARHPQPAYLPAGTASHGTNYYDLAYHLLELFCDHSYDMAVVLHPLTWTPHPLDYRLSWSLYTLLSVLRLFPNNRHSPTLLPLEYDLCLGYADQLESAGLWEWAVYVLLNLTERPIASSSPRETAVALILDRHADELTTNPLKEAFLVHRLGVPKTLVSVAKATYAHYTGDYRAEVSALISSCQWEHAHDLFLNTLVGKLFLEGSSQPRRSPATGFTGTAGVDVLPTYLDEASPSLVYLRSILNTLETNKYQIKDWKLGGGVFLTYLCVVPSVTYSSALFEVTTALEKVIPLAPQLDNLRAEKNWDCVHDRLMEAIKGMTGGGSRGEGGDNRQTYLHELLTELEVHRDEIKDWNLGGAVYLNHLSTLAYYRSLHDIPLYPPLDHPVSLSQRLTDLAIKTTELVQNLQKSPFLQRLSPHHLDRSVEDALKICTAVMSTTLYKALVRLEAMRDTAVDGGEDVSLRQSPQLKVMAVPTNERLVLLEDMTGHYLRMCIRRKPEN